MLPQTVRICVAVCLVSWAWGCAGRQPPTETSAGPLRAEQLYPLQAGRAWSYDAVARDGTPVLAISRVVERQGAVAEVTTGQGSQRYEVRPDGVFRMARGAYLLQDPIEPGHSWPSGGGQEAKVARMDVAIETPAGHFEGCVEVLEAGAESGLEIRTLYCPDVGPVRVEAAIEVRGQRLMETAVLRGYAPSP